MACEPNFIISGNWKLKTLQEVVELSTGALDCQYVHDGIVDVSAGGGTITLPVGETGMSVRFVHTGPGTTTVNVQPGESLNGVLNGTHNFGRTPRIFHVCACISPGNWYIG